jgi:hypothetical protein
MPLPDVHVPVLLIVFAGHFAGGALSTYLPEDIGRLTTFGGHELPIRVRLGRRPAVGEVSGGL